jgi:CRP/FNR family cyclic AMP-dependent transcriptional regulator
MPKKKNNERAILKNINILKDLTDSELDQVLEICTRKEVPKGEIIMDEGEVGETMYFFVDGVVDIKKALTLKIGRKGFENVEKSMIKLDSNIVSFFGEMAMIDNSPRSASVTAATDCLLYEIHREEFDALCKKSSTIGLKMMRRISQVLSKNVRKGNEDVMKLTTALSIALAK